MKNRLFLLCIIFSVAVAASCANQESSRTSKPGAAQPQANSSQQNAPRASTSNKKLDAHGHDHSNSRVPKFQVDAASLNNLPPTLAPEQFTGKTREAYQVVRQIPKTIAQLPCYCYCDEGHGHKSLYSCYVDNHASMCAVCVDEALIAYRLEKEQKLKPEQIRERIVSQYSAQQ